MKTVRLTVETHNQLSELKWRKGKSYKDLVGSIVDEYYHKYMEEVHSSSDKSEELQEKTSSDDSFNMMNPDDFEDRSTRKDIYIFDEEDKH